MLISILVDVVIYECCDTLYSCAIVLKRDDEYKIIFSVLLVQLLARRLDTPREHACSVAQTCDRYLKFVKTDNDDEVVL